MLIEQRCVVSITVCHAELNAIFNKTSANLRDCTMYVSLFPCNECAKLIIQAGIRKVVYASDTKFDKDEYLASRRLLCMAGVKQTLVVMPFHNISKKFSTIYISLFFCAW